MLYSVKRLFVFKFEVFLLGVRQIKGHDIKIAEGGFKERFPI
jgi:hypothetical protein